MICKANDSDCGCMEHTAIRENWRGLCAIRYRRIRSGNPSIANKIAERESVRKMCKSTWYTN